MGNSVTGLSICTSYELACVAFSLGFRRVFFDSAKTLRFPSSQILLSSQFPRLVKERKNVQRPMESLDVNTPHSRVCSACCYPPRPGHCSTGDIHVSRVKRTKNYKQTRNFITLKKHTNVFFFYRTNVKEIYCPHPHVGIYR